MRGRASAWRFDGIIEDPLGEERDVSYSYVVRHESQSHPYGSTSATETWDEVDDESERFTLDGHEVTLDELREALGGPPDEALLERWRYRAARIDPDHGEPDD